MTGKSGGFTRCRWIKRGRGVDGRNISKIKENGYECQGTCTIGDRLVIRDGEE